MTVKHINLQGSTVVELVLYMGLLSIFILALFDIFSQILNTQTRSVAVSLVQTNGNFLLTKLTQDINRAESISVPVAIGDTGNTLTLQIGSTSAVYTITDGRLRMVDSTGTYNLNDVDTTISNFNVQKLGNPLGRAGVQLSLTITSNVVDNANTKTLNFQTFATTR